MAECCVPTLLKLPCYKSILWFRRLVLPFNTVRLIPRLLKGEFN